MSHFILACGAKSEEHPGGLIKTLPELIAAAKAKPGGLTVATLGNGSTPHLAMELFQHTAGLSFRHVPYKGGAQAITDVMGGHVDVVAVNARSLATGQGRQAQGPSCNETDRSAVLPGVPTVAESGYSGFEASVWYGFIAPAGLPKPILVELHDAVQKAIASPEVRVQLATAEGIPLPGPTDQFEKLLKADAARYGKLIRDAHIKPD